MTVRRFRVEINGEPYLLRSAIFACIDGDSRFDVVMADARDHATGDVGAHGNSSSDAQTMPVVLTVAPDGPLRLQSLLDGATRSIPYQSMRRLADALIRELDNCNTWTKEIAVTPHA